MKKKLSNVDSTEKNPLNPLGIVLMVVLIIYALSLIGLLLWGVMSSFKGNIDFTDHPYQFPKKFVNNIPAVLDGFYMNVKSTDGLRTLRMTVGDMFMYSFLYAFGCGLAATIVPCITAYICAKYPFKFMKVIYMIVVVVMIMPLVGNLPSELEMAMRLNIYNTVYGLWIMKANFLGMYFLVFYNVFRAFPISYMEAAKMDGANNFTVMIRITFPLVANTFATVLLINFINFWNDYQVPLMYMPSYPTIAYGLFTIVSGTTTAGLQNIPSKVTAAVIVIVPILILFLIFQKRLLGNLTVGGVKG